MNEPIPRKRFGQHFLTDDLVLEKISDAFSPKNNQIILEIGPGTGALTACLLDRVERFSAVELDRDLVRKLQKNYNPDRLNIIQCDILSFDVKTILTAGSADQKIRIIGNLPYNISTPLIFHLLESVEYISDMLFMLQKEVALRLCAKPGDSNYGRLSVMAGLSLQCEQLFNVPPESFNPPPKVNSTVIRLVPLSKKDNVKNRDRFDAIVRQAFSQRRKTLRNSLQKLVSAQCFEKAGVDPSLRAENISADQYIQLSNVIDNYF